MKKRFLKIGMVLLSFVWLNIGVDALAKEPPVSMLTQIKGDIQYSKNGKKWKKVRRNKFLFAGYHIKTGADGSGKFVNQASNMTRKVGPNSLIDITKEGAQKVSGTLSDAKQASGNLSSSLSSRFKKAQRYTTVRRSVEKKRSLKLYTVKKIKLSSTYPNMVWANQGSEYTYQLIIDGTVHNVGASNNDMVRFKVAPLSPGKHTYQVNVMKDGDTVYKPRKTQTITWLSDSEQAKIDDELKAIEQSSNGDNFLKANYLDEQGLSVAAMDVYRDYFKANPDDLDMFPMLIKAYHDLKLPKLKKAGALQLQEMMKAEDES